MSWGLDLLELDEDADERSIKRAYAKRLRVTRPDDDPVAFQQLHEAYQAALAWAQQRAQWQDEEEEEDAADDTTRAFMPTQEAHAVHPAAWVQDAAGQVAAALDHQGAEDERLHGHDPVHTVAGLTTPLAAVEVDRATLPVTVACDAVRAEPALRSVEQMVAAVLARLADTAGAQGDEAAATALEAWLQAQPELWSLRDKPRIGALLLDSLREHPLPLHRSAFERLAASFGWDDVTSGIDAIDLQRIAHRGEQAWLLSAAGQKSLGWHMSRLDGSIAGSSIPTVVDRLGRPRSRWRNVLAALPWSRPNATVLALVALGYWPERELPPGLSAPQVAFWSRFGDPKDPLRFRVGSLRAWLVGLLCGVFCLMGVVNSWPLSPTEGGMPGSTVAALTLAIGTLLAPLAWYLFVGFRVVANWQVNPMLAGRWRQSASIPLLVLLSAGLLLWFGHESFPVILGMLLGRVLVFALCVVALLGHGHQRQRLGLASEGVLERFAALPGMILPWLGLVVVLGYWLRTLVLRRRASR